MEIKVCGMRDQDNCTRLLTEVAPDWMGLIFYAKSPRFVSEEMAAYLQPLSVKKVGVFVRETEKEMLRLSALFGLSALQLHGGESVDEVKSLREATDLELWKVVSVGETIDWNALAPFVPYVDKFLFDTATAAHGGSGKQFDWQLLENYPFATGFYLSGGINESHASALGGLKQRLPRLLGLDLNSGFEVAPGLKNIEKLQAFTQNLSS